MPRAIFSVASHWRDLAQELLRAIERLEAAYPTPAPTPAIRIDAAPDLDCLRVSWCGLEGGPAVVVHLGQLPPDTDRVRDDGHAVPNASIDRAVSLAASSQLSWSKDPDSFEVREHRRHRLVFAWPDTTAEEVDPWAYGLWDE